MNNVFQSQIIGFGHPFARVEDNKKFMIGTDKFVDYVKIDNFVISPSEFSETHILHETAVCIKP